MPAEPVVQAFPLHLARLQPTQDLHFLIEEDCIVFGGLIPESPDFCRMLEKDYWKAGSCNGVILKVDRPVSDVMQAMSVPVGKTKRWVPDGESLDNIEATALKIAGIGEIGWRGSLGSPDNPLEAIFTRNGVTTGEGNRWSWRDAVNGLMAKASDKELERFSVARIEAAHAYGKAVLETAAQIRRGDVYGVVAYAAPLGGKARIEKLDVEEWELVGRKYALETLKQTIADVAKAAHEITLEVAPAENRPARAGMNKQ